MNKAVKIVQTIFEQIITVRIFDRLTTSVAACYNKGYRGYSSTRYFLFAVANFHFSLQLLQSIDEMLEFMETWGFSISFATCQPGNKSELYVLIQGLDPPGPRYADPPPVLRHWQFVLKHFRY